VFTPELPKTRSGKIMRRLLRDVAEQRTLGDTTTLADPAWWRRSSAGPPARRSGTRTDQAPAGRFAPPTRRRPAGALCARRYQAQWWAAVFPLGMYSVATGQLAVTLDLHPLESLAGIAFWAALGAWSLTTAAAACHWISGAT
jgi:Voltage-dependent anion channel